MGQDSKRPQLKNSSHAFPKNTMTLKIPLLTGPTASGKTALSLELAALYPLETISADSMMVYRGMDIGTAKPSLEERALVPHHLIDVRDPWQDYDVTQFVQDAETAIADVLERGKTPLVVGGTGFYISALTSGLTTTPKADLSVQRELEAELAGRGLDALLEQVQQVRPSELARLERNPRRVIRALELYRRTGKFPSQFPRTTPRFQYASVALSPPREDLERRIELRVNAMLSAGLVQEVHGLYLKMSGFLERYPTSFQAIGYKEVLEHMEPEWTRPQDGDRREVLLGPNRKRPDPLRETLILNTRQYAKRQLTWIRTQLKLETLTLERARERLEEILALARG